MWSLLYSCCFCFIAFVSHKHLVASCYCGGHFQCPMQEWKQLWFVCVCVCVFWGGNKKWKLVLCFDLNYSVCVCLCSYFYVFYGCTVMLVLFTEQHWLNGRAYTYISKVWASACPQAQATLKVVCFIDSASLTPNFQLALRLCTLTICNIEM